MEIELKEKFSTDENFVKFCKIIDCLKAEGDRIEIPLETAVLILATGIDFVKGESLDIVHRAVEEYMEYVSGNISFYDYFISQIIW